MFKMSIPKITQEELKKRYEKVKPVVTVGGKLHYLRDFSFNELRSANYLGSIYADIRKEVVDNELEPFCEFSCLHGFMYPAFFFPTIKEVLAQISKYDLFFAKAFEIIESPKTIDDLKKDGLTLIAYKNGYHVSTVRLYR